MTEPVMELLIFPPDDPQTEHAIGSIQSRFGISPDANFSIGVDAKNRIITVYIYHQQRAIRPVRRADNVDLGTNQG